MSMMLQRLNGSIGTLVNLVEKNVSLDLTLMTASFGMMLDVKQGTLSFAKKIKFLPLLKISK